MFMVLFIASRFAMIMAAYRENTDWLSFSLFLFSGGLLEYMIWHTLTRGLRSGNVTGVPALCVATILNLLYASICIIDLRVFSAFRRPLDLMLVREAVAAMPLPTMLTLLTPTDWLFISLALLTPIAARLPVVKIRTPARLPGWLYACAGMFFIVGLFAGRWAPQIAAPAVRVPLLFALNQFQTPSGLVAAAGLSSEKMAVEELPPEPGVQTARSAIADKTNVILVVLESTGARYVFDASLTHPGKGMPMPFLHSLSQKSLYLARHYATANSSPRALFSIFTGLYPEPVPEFFSLRKNLQIKTWTNILPAASQFLVTPCAVEWYFPLSLLKNNGITEIFGQRQLEFSEQRTHPAEGRNEEQTVDFFIDRVLKAKQPFLATYISFAPHYPYHDYGERWHVAKGDDRLDRYVDNLRLVDAQLQKIHDALQNRGMWKNTVMVVVGDHSEAFRQHKGNYIHSLHSYEENLAVPALIYAPHLLKPRRIDFATSHVDLGPTVLDMLRLPFPARQFQGVSLLRGTDREHILAYGNEETVTVYSRNGVKTQLLRTGICRRFNLAVDPAELQRLECPTGLSALRVARSYKDHQPELLENLQRRAVESR